VSTGDQNPARGAVQTWMGMHFLISNDDGIEARGIQVLAGRMREIGRVTIVAPDQNRSGASNSLTLDSPVRVREMGGNEYRVTGTPSDCVHIALTGLLEKDPDIVISGINSGANLGDDVIYSGTVAAAMEGRFLGLPAIAVSLVFEERPQHYRTAAEAVALLVQRLRMDPLPADTILNMNVPDLPWDRIRGFEVTRLGHRHRAEPVVRMVDPRGNPMYWIGPAGPGQDAGPGTDFDAVRRGFISITPIHVDLTRYQALDQVAGWVAEIPTAGVTVAEDQA
jgi:5'-nucleotidase